MTVMTTITPTPTMIVNAIAGALGHGHTLATEEAAKHHSLRGLQAAWKAEGILRNQAADIVGLEGWEQEPAECLKEYKVIPSTSWRLAYGLTHTTTSGRLIIDAVQWGTLWQGWQTNWFVRLGFWAGPDYENGSPREVADLVLIPKGIVIQGVNADLLNARPDRVELLVDIDRELSGMILVQLSAQAEKGCEDAALLVEAMTIQKEIMARMP